jgi:hypothetical protein
MPGPVRSINVSFRLSCNFSTPAMNVPARKLSTRHEEICDRVSQRLWVSEDAAIV